MLSLQRTAGNQAVTRALRPTLSRLVEGATADLFDYDDLATQIFEAIDGPGTDEQKIFHVARAPAAQPGRDHPAARGLRPLRGPRRRPARRPRRLRAQLRPAAHERRRRRRDGDDRRRADVANAELRQLRAKRIREAVEGGGHRRGGDLRRAAAASRAAAARSRSSSSATRRCFGEDMRARLVDELTAEEFQHAAYLMGEAALEQTEVSPAEAQRIFTVMAAADLHRRPRSAGRRPVPLSRRRLLRPRADDVPGADRGRVRQRARVRDELDAGRAADPEPVLGGPGRPTRRAAGDERGSTTWPRSSTCAAPSGTQRW